MAELQSLSDRELRAKLTQHGIDIPVTKSTRDLAIKKLSKIINEKVASNGSSSATVAVHEEPASPPPSNNRRRSTAPKTRSSLVPSRVEQKTDESEEEVEPAPRKSVQPSTPKSLNGGNNQASHSDSPGHLTDDELLKQLASHNIPTQGVTQKNRAILVKKLNHAVAKSRRESKSFATKSRDTEEDSEPEVEQEIDCPDNASFVSAKDRRISVTSSLSFSPQHSLTMTNNSSFTNNDSVLKPRLSDFPRPFIPSANVNRQTPNNTTYSRPSPSVIVNKPTPNRVLNRFVEEQEHYDTGSDSDTESVPVRSTPKKSWRFFSSWFSPKKSNTSTPVKKSSLLDNLKGKINLLWQWQFIAVVLPLLAVAFFVLLAAFYIKASYSDQIDAKDVSSTSKIDPALYHMLQNVKSLLEKEASSRLCSGIEVDPVESSFLTEQLKMDQTVLDSVKEVVQANPQLGVVVDEEFWSVPAVQLPLLCKLKSYLWNALVTTLIVIFGFVFVVLVHHFVTAKNRQREKEEQEVFSLVEKTIDLLARHQSVMLSSGRPHDAFLAVSHVRDVLIPLKERKSKQPLWSKVVRFLEENESRVRPEIQQIEGEDFQVWRWLPPSTTYSPGQGTTSEGTGDDVFPGTSGTPNANPRPKVWQGQAFSTDSSGVNSPPPYPLTQCLKVRNMFDAEVEVGDSWPVRIQDAILEKAEKGKILHMAVDRGSREGCVYIKCSSADEAGKVYRSLHGWWFDGNLVTVKYLRPERYHHRFPDSAAVTIPLQPSNDKRLSLQTKFWKSPLEHF